MRVGYLLFGLLLLPTGAAKVTIESPLLPTQTVADRPFEVSLVLANDGNESRVNLLAALYAKGSGEPCGPATDPDFRTFTQLVQEDIIVPARARTSYPPEGERWLQRYSASHVAGPEMEFCLFVARDAGTPRIQYEDFEPLTLRTRETNTAPRVAFTWEPATPRATEDVTLTAQGSDADGDMLRYEWDLGKLGAEVTTFFFPAGEHAVTVVASDGFDTATATHFIRVIDENAPRDPTPIVTKDTPAPIAPALLLIACLAHTKPRGHDGTKDPRRP